MANNEAFVDDGSLEALNTRWENAVKKYWSGSPGEFIPKLNIKPVIGSPFGTSQDDEMAEAKEIFKRRNGGNGA